MKLAEKIIQLAESINEGKGDTGTWKIDKKAVEKQIDAAMDTIEDTYDNKLGNNVVVITANKTDPSKDKITSYGYHFEQKKHNVKLGDIQDLGKDGVRKIVHIIDKV